MVLHHQRVILATMFRLGTLLAMIFCLFAAAPSLSAAEPTITSKEVKEIVHAQLKKKVGYKEGDLLTRADLQPILAKLAARGLPIEEAAIGFDPYLPNDHYLARLFQNAQAKEKMRKIGHIPGIYDRLERLASFPEGQAFIQKIVVESKDTKAAEWLCTSEGAREVEVDFGNNKSIRNFSIPSGRVFNEATFLTHVQTMQTLIEKDQKRPGE